MATGRMLMDKIERELHAPAMSADPERLEAGVYALFAPNVRIVTSDADRPRRLDDVLPTWLAEVEAWTPQAYEILDVVDTGDTVTYEYCWTATHTGDLRLPDGRELAATGLTVDDRVTIFARWDGTRVTRIHRHCQRYSRVLEQLTTQDERVLTPA
jgi:hypothetical protein